MPSKSIVAINADIPNIDSVLSYESKGSLRDYDIAIFSPGMPYQSRIEFSGGGSCISVEGTKVLSDSLNHWSRELRSALAVGKTIFIILGEMKVDSGATGSSMKSRTERTYHTTAVNNYNALPVRLGISNARGKSVVVKDRAYRGFFEAIEGVVEYRVVFDDATGIKPIAAAKDGTVIGGVAKLKDLPGHMVLLPYFNFYTDEYVKSGTNGDEEWNDKAIQTGHALVRQIVSIDKLLREKSDRTPEPEWLAPMPKPNLLNEIDGRISAIDLEMEDLRMARIAEVEQRASALVYSHLLYETGKPLEAAVEAALRLLGYSVTSFQAGDLEIDHMIVGPSGKRMIGETEGKDTSAIDISKFRQLESNIGEDFERDEVHEPAKGLLFGNGFRLSQPSERGEQFTQKSLTNARRLGSALVQTADLYPLMVYLLDNPSDEVFRKACRDAIELTEGGLVAFPLPPVIQA